MKTQFIYYRVRVTCKLPNLKPLDLVGIVVAEAGRDMDAVKVEAISKIISDISRTTDVTRAKITSSIRKEDINFIMFQTPKEKSDDTPRA